MVLTVPVGQEYAAQMLLAELIGRGVQVELQHQHNPLTRRRAAAMVPQVLAAWKGGAVGSASTVVVTAEAGALNSAADIASGQLAPRPSSEANTNVGMGKVEDMSPLRIFESYMSQVDVAELNATSVYGNAAAGTALEESSLLNADPAAANISALQKLHQSVLLEGRTTIDRLLGVATGEGSAGLASAAATSRAGAERRVKELVLDKVLLSNFGPYGGERAVEYPLNKRGLVLIRGQSMDGTGADSNGAGKVRLCI